MAWREIGNEAGEQVRACCMEGREPFGDEVRIFCSVWPCNAGTRRDQCVHPHGQGTLSPCALNSCKG